MCLRMCYFKLGRTYLQNTASYILTYGVLSSCATRHGRNVARHGWSTEGLDAPADEQRKMGFRPYLDITRVLLPFLGMVGHPCHFLTYSDIPTISCLVGHPCHFLAYSDIPAISWISGAFLGSCRLLAFWNILAISWLSRTSLPFSGFLGHPCYFLAFKDSFRYFVAFLSSP
ncbi:hypothetical protein Taro_043002, partial [Colocasia esculenta]|nr:hypothetical protein [Colocasia esculenta]